MEDDVIIKVSSLSKDFILPHEKNTSLKSAVVNFYRNSKSYENQHALKNVSFEVKKGEFFGIVGRNGSGKSTLLKTLAGIYVPTKGDVEVRGKLTPFIELGVGFNPELTGRENVYLNGSLLGFNRKEMRAMYKDIVDFAELERFMDQKLKNYSSGMQVRLAFSIAIRAKSDILLIDEVLAVGDANFQKKSMGIIESLKRQGRTILFVTHSMEHVREFCDKVVVIDGGEVVYNGGVEKAIDVYNKINFTEENLRTDSENQTKKIERFGNGKAEIVEYGFIDENNKKTSKLQSRGAFNARIKIHFNDHVTNPAVGVMFKKNPQENLFGINNFYQKLEFGEQQKGDNLTVNYKGQMPLAPGTYFVSFSVTDAKSAAQYSELDMLDNVLKINVQGEPEWGLISADIMTEAE